MTKIFAIMAAMIGAAACSAGTQGAAGYPTDTIVTRDGSELRITFIVHGSVGFEYGGANYYVDPVTVFAGDFSAFPRAEVIALTHDHSDHTDAAAIKQLSRPQTLVIGNPLAIEKLGHEGIRGDVLGRGQVRKLAGDVSIEAIAAYNTSPEKLGFHPRERLGNGYVFTFGGTRVYVAGDTEPTPEMAALKDIDIAFVPVNLPYTMTEEQAATAVRSFGPRIFYPYHTGQTDHTTDLAKLEKQLTGSGIEVRIRPME